MPVWNCLCSTKRKRRPEITSPILNTEGTDNLPQLIPQSTPASPGSYKYDKRQKLSSKKHRHLLAGNRDNCGDGGNENDNENDEKIKTKFLKKKESKKKCEIVKSRKQSNQVKLKQSKKETKAERKENNNKQKQEEHNNKLSKQLTNVRFAFETPSKTKTHHESVAKVNSTRINEEEEITEGGEEHERGDESHRCICNNNAKKEIFLRSFSSSPPSQVPLESSPPESTSAATGAALYDVKKKDVFNEQNQEQQYQKQHQQKRGEEEQERRQQQQQSRSDNIETVDEEKTINENSGNYDEIPAVTIRTKTSLEETSLARSSNRPVHSNTVTTAETEIQVIVNEPCASYFPLSSNNSNSKSTFHSFKSATSPHHQLKIVGLSSNGAAVIGKSFHIGSHDSIPFIDEEMTISKSLASPALIIGSSESGKRSPGQNHENGIQENDHEARFITLQPKNIGSPHVIPEHIRAEQAQKYLESISSSQKDLNAFSTHHDIIIITEEYLDEQENKSQKEQSQGEKSTTIITTAGSSAHNHHNNKERNEFKNQKEIVDNPTAAAAVAVNHTGQNNGSSNSPMEKSVEHNFYVWQARNTRVCQVCHESLLIHSTSSLRCQSCDLVCHSWCASSMNDILNQRGQRIFQKSHNVENGEEHTIPKSQSFPAKGSSHLYQEAPDALRLHYVTQRILATVLPRRSSIDPALRRSPSERVLQDKYEEEVILMLEQKHGKKYRVFDLESCISVVTLERICELCKHIDKWLNDGKDNVVVLQDRGDRQRLGTAIAAYLEYLDICGSNVTPRNRVANEDLQAQNTIARNWVALDIFSMKRFLEDFIGPLKLPSHRRYLNYFSGLLSGRIRMNSSPLNLRFISLESPSLWLQYNSNSKYSSQSEWSSFIKIYEGLRCIYTSDIHIIPITTRQFLFKTGNLRLRGDILIRCYQINFMENNNYTERCRELLFSIQFHTCAITKNEINFLKEDLDYAFNDPRLPRDHKVTFHFYSGNVSDTNGLIIQSPLIRTEPPNELARADSIERFDPSSAYHINGPIDGSLYATILKSPKSPSSEKFLTNNHNNNYSTLRTSSQRIKTQEQSNLISPPPQFSNGKSEIIKREPLNTSTPIKQIAISNNCVNFNNNNNSNNRLRSPSQTRSDYSYVDSGGSRPQTSQSNYQQQQPGKQAQLTIVRQTTYQSAEQNSNGHQDQDQHQQQHHHHHHHQQSRQSHHQHGVAGRESVRSPLTLSMDSGISSSGILNRPQQGSSVSPSSFPSQASPQEDRHRELDDILSDMLMNVRDIPDFGNSKTYNRQHQIGVQKIVRSQSVIPGASSSSNYSVIPVQRSSSAQYNHIANSNTLTVGKRSQSYLSAEGTPLGQSRGNSYLSVKDPRSENYETSSTTTLTPPPSESGRDTPVAVNGHIGYSSTLNSESSNIARSAIIEYREKREIHHNLRQQNSISNTMSERRPQSLNSRPAVQSSGYSQSVRTSESISSPIPATTSEDEENIPYHAREDSRPFTYGNIIPSPQLLNNTHNNNINNSKNHSNSQIITEQELLLLEENSDPAMIKAQSGLSSPSLVRKTLGGSAHTLRKTPPRNDFEELLRERREKVLSEKYSTLDKPLSAINTYNRNYERRYLNTDTWNSKDTPNGYYYYNEPLKRSNTLDGFHRSTSTDGLSGQTWLQLQQQKLRAKKDQQLREERRYYDELVQTEIRNSRPFRARYQRNDGYASDTAAFGDEVDYRRPLHIQTPSRSPERNYHTLSSTTTTTSVTKERPFVSVKRAHEQARKDTYGAREESFSSYRSETEPELSIAGSPRPETPAFPVTPRTPYGYTYNTNGSVSPALPPKSPTSQRKDLYTGSQRNQLHHEIVNQNEQISSYTTRRNSNASNANSEPQEVAPHHVKFVRDSSKYWYKPNLSRDEAVALLRNAVPGTFIVRDSTTFKNAFGLVVRVAFPPPGIASGPNGDELVRHFLVEPTSRGVRLKGCANEPVFTSLSALVYQHSITPLALPCRLLIPDRDIQFDAQTPAQKQLLTQGAACNVLYLFSCETESLTGEEAIRKAVSQLYSRKPLPTPTEVHFKVSLQGITLTDVTRQKFFRKHYPANAISFCGLDPDGRLWSVKAPIGDIPVNNKTIFAFVARRSASSTDNQCHVFCDLASAQPATAIISFANKTLPTEEIMNHNNI